MIRMGRPDTNTGHGHVWAWPDGVKARCGCPATCRECVTDAALWVVVHTRPDGTMTTLGGVVYTDLAQAQACVDARRWTAAKFGWADRYEVRQLASEYEVSR